MFKLFGSKKKEEFFVEIGDATEQSVEAKPAAPVEAAKAEAPVEAAKAEAPVEAAKAEAPETKTKTKKTSIKNKAAKAQAPAATPVAPAPAPAPKKPAPDVLFAPNYLMPTPSSTRRRPGANMNGFLDMAQQYKKR
jgi:hypothetical protein